MPWRSAAVHSTQKEVGITMGAFIILVLIIAILLLPSQEKRLRWKKKPLCPKVRCRKFMLPASNGFARMSLPVTNRYNLPVDGFVAFDVETANEQPYSICSISAVKVQGSSIVDVITSLIKPPETRFTNTSIHALLGKRSGTHRPLRNTTNRRFTTL